MAIHLYKKSFELGSLEPSATSHDVEDYIQEAQDATSIDQIHALCVKLTQNYGFDYFVYGTRFKRVDGNPFFYAINGYPDEWVERYLEENSFDVDPRMQHCETHLTPLAWQTLKIDSKIDPAGRQFMLNAREYGIKTGIITPVHGFAGDSGVLAFCESKDYPLNNPRYQRILPCIYLLSSYIHESVCRILTSSEYFMQSIALTAREKEILRWVAEGKESWVISRILKISENTVLWHMKNVHAKLGVNNRQHAVAKALMLKLIEL